MHIKRLLLMCFCTKLQVWRRQRISIKQEGILPLVLAISPHVGVWNTQQGSFFQFISSRPSPIVFPSTKSLGFQHKVFPFSWPPIMATKNFFWIWPLEYETISEFIHQIPKHYFLFLYTTYFKQLVLNALTCGFFCVSEFGWQGSTCPC